MQVVQSSIMSRLFKNPRFISLLLYADVLNLIFMVLLHFRGSVLILKTVYPREKGPKQELYNSSRQIAVVCFLRSTCNFFWLFFWAGYCCFTIKQRARIMVGLEHPTIRLRGGDLTTSLPLPNFTTAPNSTKKKNSRQK